MDRIIDHPRFAPAAVVGISVASLAGALVSDHWGGLEPCILCIYQRYAYGVALACGALGLVLAASRLARGLFLIGAGLAFFGGAAIAAFHTGVERKWWRGTEACHAPPLDTSLSIDQQLDQLLNQPFVPCDFIPWSLFGLSMANYNVLASLAFAGFCVWAVKRMRKGDAA